MAGPGVSVSAPSLGHGLLSKNKDHERPNVANDPFLTHSLQIARPRTSPAEPVQTVAEAAPRQANVNNDPFMTHQPGHQQIPTSTIVDLKNDPFMKHTHLEERKVDEVPQTANVIGYRSHVQTFMALLGPGDPERTPQALRHLSALPWFTFVWTLMLWFIMRHYSFSLTVTLNIIGSLVFSACIAAGLQGRIGNKDAPLLAVGLLCLIAVILGTCVGLASWQYLYRPYWWYSTGRHAENTYADTPAGARADAAVISFWNTAADQTNGGTQVDHERAAGYRSGSMYCVAPILSPNSVLTGLARVNYWAIGIDCCEPLGSFTCDDSRNRIGGYGVVMLDDGFPCPGCNADLFKAAVHKAEAAHGMASTMNPLFVRWVAAPTSIQWSLSWRCMLFFLVSCFLASWLFSGLAWIAWYKGVGKEGGLQWRELQSFQLKNLVRGIRRRLA